MALPAPLINSTIEMKHILYFYKSTLFTTEYTEYKYYGNELKNKTLGIIGYGRLGKMVARYGRAFQMSVIAFDRDQTSNDEYVRFMTLNELVSKSDIITVHLSLNDETKGIINENMFKQMI